jgi:OmpA-OmpF porin, OOP family
LNIEFEIDREVIQLDEQEKLAVLASFLERYPETNAVIEGHTDSVGEAQLNQQLSERRAQSVVDYLVSKHQIARSRLVASGQGELRPIADNRTQDGKRANRRISAIVGCATDFAGLEQLPARITIAMHLEFDTDSAFVMPKYYAQLGSVARFLEANPATVATVEGHTDSASPDMALQISRQRAQNIASVLIEQFGVDPSRLKVQGFGSTRKVAYNISAEGRQQNRRANIIIDYPK